MTEPRRTGGPPQDGLVGSDPIETVTAESPTRSAEIRPDTADGRGVVGSALPQSMAGVDELPPVSGAGSPSLGTPSGRVRRGDRIFYLLATGAGVLTIALIALVAAFLVVKGFPAIRDDKQNFLFSRGWSVNGADLRFGVVDLLYTTVAISVLAMLLAVPVAIGIALFITHYAPARLARPVGYVIDLLAAIPSIIYGVWGIIVLAPVLEPVQRFFYVFDVIPLVADKGYARGTVFNGGIVLAIMILPIVTAVSRDVFERTPRANIEAAWALGSTRWEMIRLAVLPHGRPGVISGAMLGLGRALGETIAITLILSTVPAGKPFSWSIFNGGETFASKIANASAEFGDPRQTGAYIAAGLVLFVLTFAVNAAARIVVNRRKEFV
ncbi:MAG: phosphate ABC transporter permease subunit PstC [bacterium]